MALHESVLLAVYAAILTLLSLFALHRLMLAWAASTYRPPELTEGDGSDAQNSRQLPSVLVQLPLYNEPRVVERLLAAVAALDYPRENLSIQVLDDSTDDTPELVAAALPALRDAGLQIDHVRRVDRVGYKAGALAAGLAGSTSEYVAILDADFIPNPDFLRRLIPHFASTDVGMVQARWLHINRNDSALTRAQATLLDGHFVNEHGGRAARGCFFNFNGTAGIWRRACIDDAGGWSGRTLTEDLDLSYRAQLRGWRFVYLPDVGVPAELPDTVDAFKTQQHRWAKGAIETAKFMLPEIWRTPGLALRRRIEASFHLLGNLAYPLVVILGLLMPPVAAISREDAGWLWVMDGALLLGSTGSLMAFYALALRGAGQGRSSWVSIPPALALGAGLAFNSVRAIAGAAVGKISAFERTPKSGVVGGHALPLVRREFSVFARARINVQGVLELSFGAYTAAAVVVAIECGHYAAAPFFLLFCSGFIYLGGHSVVSSLFAAAARREGSEEATASSSGNTLTGPPMPKRI